MIANANEKIHERKRLESRQWGTLALVGIVTAVALVAMGRSVSHHDPRWQVALMGLATALGLAAVYRFQAKASWRNAIGTGLGLAAVYVLGIGGTVGQQHWMGRVLIAVPIVIALGLGARKAMDD